MIVADHVNGVVRNPSARSLRAGIRVDEHADPSAYVLPDSSSIGWNHHFVVCAGQHRREQVPDVVSPALAISSRFARTTRVR